MTDSVFGKLFVPAEVEEHLREIERREFGGGEFLPPGARKDVTWLIEAVRYWMHHATAHGREAMEVEELLAAALGYTYHEEIKGYATGDHTPVTLAMQAKKEIERLYLSTVVRAQAVPKETEEGSST